MVKIKMEIQGKRTCIFLKELTDIRKEITIFIKDIRAHADCSNNWPEQLTLKLRFAVKVVLKDPVSMCKQYPKQMRD
jgi:hypothetical protein